jgi:hypothetical protein
VKPAAVRENRNTVPVPSPKLPSGPAGVITGASPANATTAGPVAGEPAPANAALPIEVTDAGISTVSRALPWNACASTLVTPEPSVRDVSGLPRNAARAIEVTPSGMSRVVIAFASNIPRPIPVRPAPIVTDVRRLS